MSYCIYCCLKDIPSIKCWFCRLKACPSLLQGRTNARQTHSNADGQVLTKYNFRLISSHLHFQVNSFPMLSLISYRFFLSLSVMSVQEWLLEPRKNSTAHPCLAFSSITQSLDHVKARYVSATQQEPKSHNDISN